MKYPKYNSPGFSNLGIHFTKKQRHKITLYCIQNRRQKINFYKLEWLLYFFAYRLNRWLGGITKWERRDPQATSKMSWEACMALMRLRALRLRTLERLLSHKLSPIALEVINEFAEEIKKLKKETS